MKTPSTVSELIEIMEINHKMLMEELVAISPDIKLTMSVTDIPAKLLNEGIPGGVEVSGDKWPAKVITTAISYGDIKYDFKH